MTRFLVIWLVFVSIFWMTHSIAAPIRSEPAALESYRQTDSSSSRTETAPESARPLPKSTGTELRPNPVPSNAEPAQQDYYLTVSGCIIPGSTVILYSRQSTLSQTTAWFLKSGIHYRPVHSLPVSNNAIKLMLPNEHALNTDGSFGVFYKPQYDHDYQSAQIEISFCHQEQATQPSNGELVIMAVNEELPDMLLYFSELGVVVIEQQWLEKLAMQLIRIEPDADTARKLLKQFNSRFPSSAIDENHYYSQTEASRHYAKQQVHWPEKKVCAALDFSSLRVGLIDSLVDTTHPHLKYANIQMGHFADLQDHATEHATALSLILVGEDDIGVSPAGLVQGATLYAAAVMEKTAKGPAATVSAMVKALDWLLVNHVRLINLSLAGQTPNRVLGRSILAANRQGALIFAAAGNDKRTDTLAYPAAFENVYAITAIDARSHLYSYANQGDFIDFSAPGVDIWITSRDGRGSYVSGTSYASPYAMAIAGFYVNRNASISRDVLYQTLKATSTDLGIIGYDPSYGWGLPTLAEISCH